MKRRDFIANGTLATVGLGNLLTASCNPKAEQPQQPKPVSSKASFELEEETIGSLQKKMANGQYSAEKLTQLYLNRIAETDQHGPALHAIIELNPDALTTARQLDAERSSGKTLGPLHGIPVLIKDNIDTADRMHTTAGSLALADHIAKKDAYVAARLKEAGAVILGKTNLSEWANFRSSTSCSGWSSRGGQTKSPYILDHNPCGSSSGSGVAVSANLCVVAIGTETDGSITCPSSVNGIVGIKPTVGLISRSGIIPISHTQDTAGPMARTVTDAAILLGILTGIDEADEATKKSEGKFHRDYTTFLDANGLKGKRIGVEKKVKGKNTYMRALQSKAVQLLEKQGAIVVEIEYLDRISKLGESEFSVLQYEFKAGLNKYLTDAGAQVKSLKEIIAFNSQHEDSVMPYFKQETLQSSEEKSGLDNKEYQKALATSHAQSKQLLDELIAQHKLDAFTGLTMGPSCSIDMIYGDRWGDVFLTQPAAITGYPHITVPCGMIYDLPVGISFFGAAFSEPALLAIAYAYEQASQSRVPPSFRKSFLA